ncbi:lipopolysaccharide heptosyltransferase I [Rhodoferax sp. TH121]|uniref:lipopolysaccharide heptosyltransferase I n=1 Tax=Rhodoferax sp. TH121 TaxID=2022803 RepID=UPI000B9619B7|nr:lipopolysaccharide heptosyltransferase I [Rhodoferax sp. TH121]OYQ43410.1 lipopolysaccharide heptosyltransferase I [Rhodoferax sp. TH121]
MSQTPAVPRILIVKLSSLGDVVHAMPAVQDLRLAYPQAQIDWVVEAAFAPLVARCEGVQQVIPCALRQWRKAPFSARTRSEWRAFKTRLQAQAYDAVIDLQGLSKSALVSWLARTTPGGKRYGLANQTEGSGFEAPARWVADVAIEIEPHVHAVQRSRILCAAGLGYVLQGPAQWGLRPGALVSVQPVKQGDNPFVPKKAVVALVHGTSRADKEWPQSSWVELGRRLNHAGFAVALLHGNAAEKATSEAIAAQLHDAWVWPAMALDAMTDTLAHCAGAVGVDSGVSHIAVALDLPHVQIYNFDTAWRTGPEVLAGTDAATAPRLPLRQVSVYGQPQPTVDAVWEAWDGLATPVLCQ